MIWYKRNSPYKNRNGFRTNRCERKFNNGFAGKWFSHVIAHPCHVHKKISFTPSQKHFRQLRHNPAQEGNVDYKPQQYRHTSIQTNIHLHHLWLHKDPLNARIMVNSLWPSDTIWRHRSGSTWSHVMAWCLRAPSHYLNQCWLIIREVQWHSYLGNFTRDASTINH